MNIGQHFVKLFPEPVDDPIDSTKFFAFICAITVFLSIICSVKYSASYLNYRILEKTGTYTTGQIVKKIYEADGRSRTTYAIIYQFQNLSALSHCARSEPRRTTSKDKACKLTVRSQPIIEAEYKRVKVGDNVDIIYMPSSEKTQSVVTGMSFNKTSRLMRSLFSFFVLILSGWFLWLNLSNLLSRPSSST